MALSAASELVKVLIWVFSPASLETRKGHVVHMSCDHDGEFNGGKGAVTPFHHVLVEYHDRFDHVFCVVDRGQVKEVMNA
jgi:hypothetical protein